MTTPSRLLVAGAVVAAALGALVAGGAIAADPKPIPPRPRPTTLEELGRLLDSQPGRLEALVEQASQDPRYREVQKYQSLRPDEYDAPKRQPKTKDILDIVFSLDAEYPLRLAAFNALTSLTAARNDPDFADDKHRNRFSLVNVVDYLVHDDARNRSFADDWLKKMHGNATDAAILNYDPRKPDKSAWKAAVNAWKRILRR